MQYMVYGVCYVYMIREVAFISSELTCEAEYWNKIILSAEETGMYITMH